jgi:outer membrane protein TolC
LGLINQSIKINERITIIDLKKSITSQYLAAFNDYVQYQFSQSVLTLLNEELGTVKTLVEKGVYLLTDLMNLQVLISSQKITITQSFIQLTNDVALLNFICGITDKTEVRLIKPELSCKNGLDLQSSPLIGINFAVPIYDGKQRKLQYDKLDLVENTRLNYKRFYSSQIKL